MSTYTPIQTPNALFCAIKCRVILHALLGDFSWSLALRLGREVWEMAPAYFPQYAEALVEQGPRAAFWEMKEISSEIPGACDLYVAMQDALFETRLEV